MRPHILVLGDAGGARDEVAAALEAASLAPLTVAALGPDTTADDSGAGGSADPGGDDDRVSGDAGGAAVSSSAPEPALVVVVGDAAGCARARARHASAPLLLVARGADADGGVGAAALAAGADDVVREPLEVPVLAARARRLVAAAEAEQRAARAAALQQVMLEILSASVSAGDSPEHVAGVLRRVADTLGLDRVWLVVRAGSGDVVYPVADTDDAAVSEGAISVAAYPALRTALDTGHPVLVDDVAESSAAGRADSAPAAGDDDAGPRSRATSHSDERFEREVRGLAVFPLLWRGEVLGALLCGHRAPGGARLAPPERGFVIQLVEHLAVRLVHGTVLARLRDSTEGRARARFEAEQRDRDLDALRDHFEAAADGVLVIDRAGAVVFVNHAAERITGFPRDQLVDIAFERLLPESQHERARAAIGDVITGRNVSGFEVRLHTASGNDLFVSVTTSTALSASGAAILTFRDITAQRALEGELRKTKDFLERLIDSAVDAIVAADMRGNILIFNKGAERIFGYSADEVIGRIPVRGLYAEGVPKQVMRMLRSTQYGGVGRIDQIRREIVNKRGERVPVNMTAAMIYEKGESVATVGIFSDLRDRIRIEQRLLQAQEKLEVTEQQAMLAQLAGTAAHELNQPLTSIQACTSMIRHMSEDDAPHMRYLETIIEQADRMANIVRNIGQITRHETKQYLPGTLIVDLDKSSGGAGGGGGAGAGAGDGAAGAADGDAKRPGEGQFRGELGGDFASEFEDDQQVTIARFALEEVMPEPEEETLVGAGKRKRAGSDDDAAEAPERAVSEAGASGSRQRAASEAGAGGEPER